MLLNTNHFVCLSSVSAVHSSSGCCLKSGEAFYCDGGAKKRTHENKGRKTPVTVPIMLLLIMTIFFVKFNHHKRCSEVVSKDGAQ